MNWACPETFHWPKTQKKMFATPSAGEKRSENKHYFWVPQICGLE